MGKGVKAGSRRASGNCSTSIGTFERCVVSLSETEVVDGPDFELILGFADNGFEVVVALEDPFEKDLVGLNTFIVCLIIGTGSSA